MAERRDSISFGNGSGQIKNPTFAMIGKNHFYILGPNRGVVTDIEQKLFQFLLQTAQFIAGTQQDHFSSLGFDGLSRLAQSFVNKFRQAFSTDPAATITLHNKL